MTPYTHRYAGRELMLFEKWEILFEGQVVRTITGVDNDFMVHMIWMMNTAYSCGYLSGHTAGQFYKEEPAV